MSSTPEVILYIATSLDGFIGSSDGGVEWLDAIQRPGEDYGYAEFFDSIDSIVMGRRTYDQALSFGPWPYDGKQCVVLSHSDNDDTPEGVEFSRDRPEQVLATLGKAGCKSTWLVGGSQVIEIFRDQNLVSNYILSVVPVILGAGIPLFSTGSSGLEDLELISVDSFDSGLVQLAYRTRERTSEEMADSDDSEE